MRWLLLGVGVLMALYLFGSFTGGGKIGLVWGLAVIGGKVQNTYTNLQLYDWGFWLYVLAMLLIIIVSVTSTSKAKKQK